jgi:hypothetical protein
MDVYAIDPHAPSASATDLGEDVPNPRARHKVSRAKVLVTFLRAKNLTAANAASQSGLMAAGGRRKAPIARTVPSEP